MYAILEHGGHQYRVTAGDRLLVDRLPADVGATVTLEPVLLVGDGDSTTMDSAELRGASVTAVVVAHRRGHKIRVFSYKPKKRHRRTLGYRSQLTELRVESVDVAGSRGRQRPRRTAHTEPANAESTESGTAGETTEVAKPARPARRRKPADGA